jgi:putative ABC transport system permease protein
MLGDIRHAFRLSCRTPGFSLVACITLALGIGATTVIFSVLDAALFRPLPYKHADRLVDVFVESQSRDGNRVLIRPSGRSAERLRAIVQVFDGVEAFSEASPMLLATGSDLAPWVGALAPSFTTLLGVSPQVGRAFTAEDVQGGGAILLSDAYWRRAFNGDTSVIGRTVTFTDRVCVVVGVMPPTFRYFVGPRTDAWLPTAERDGERLAARIRPGITLDQAQRELNTALANDGGRAMRVELSLAGWDRGSGYGRGGGLRTFSERTMLFSLLGAVGFVLAIACANVASLLLSRAAARQQETAIRSAVGATRLRLVRQFLAEGFVLAGVGGLAATGLAWGGIRVIPAAVPADLLNTILGASLPELDARVLTFELAVVTLTGLLCAIVPAIRASRPAVGGLLASGQAIAGASNATRRAQSVFQALQVAMTVVLLAGAALMVTSVVRMLAVPKAFDATNLGYASLTIPRKAYEQPAQQRAFFEELTARVTAIPGVDGAAVGNPPVASTSRRFLLDDREEAGAVALELFPVQPDYFRVVRLPLSEGRVFGPEDGPTAPRVAIISSNAASRFWPGQSAIGKQFRVWEGTPLLTVVGVVPHTRTINLASDGVEAYVPVAQYAYPSSLVFRTTGDAAPVIAAIRESVRQIDARITLARIGSVEKLYAEFDPLGSPRFYAWLLGLFAGVALVTAVVGLYGQLSHAVGRRTREIGVRIALGADLSRVRWLVVRDALGPVIVGICAGLVASRWLSRYIASQLFQTQPDDPLTCGVIVLVLLTAATAAASGPVRRASRVDPVETLRAE